MTVLISKEFQTKSEMVAAKKQLKAEIHGTFDLERQEVLQERLSDRRGRLLSWSFRTRKGILTKNY
ncbi:TPA: hypothetical protein ACNKKS_002953 [Enterococcus faecalis]